jgi:hypothetical protein
LPAAAALTLALAGLAQAQQGPPAPPPPLELGPLLQRAKESQAIDRVLGDRWFHMTGPRGEALLRVRLVPVEEPPGLAYDALLRTLDRPGAVSTQFVFGWDGVMQAFRNGVQAPGDEALVEGRVEEGVLKLTRTKGGETTQEEVAWQPAAIPAPIAMFVLPSLIDQGIPAEGALFMQFDEQLLRYSARAIRGIRPSGGMGPGLNEVRVSMATGPKAVQFSAHLSPAGHITQLLRGRNGEMRIVSIAPKLASKMMDRVVDFVPDEPQDDGSGAGSGTDDGSEESGDSGAEDEGGGSGAGD